MAVFLVISANASSGWALPASERLARLRATEVYNLGIASSHWGWVGVA
jgi:hypothetical protein